MALDPNKWTRKTQEAFAAALESAKANSNPEVTPDHLLVGVVPPGRHASCCRSSRSSASRR